MREARGARIEGAYRGNVDAGREDTGAEEKTASAPRRDGGLAASRPNPVVRMKVKLDENVSSLVLGPLRFLGGGRS